MFQNTVGAQPLVGFLDQQSSDQIFRVFRNASPFVIRKFVPALLNTGEKQFLTSLTILSSFPAAIGTAVPVERRIATEKNVHDNTETPEIATLVVIIGFPDERFDDFRCHKIGTAHRGQKLRRSHGTGQRVVEFDAGAKIEIADFDRSQFVRIHAQNVLGFQISVGNSFFMKKIQRASDLSDYLTRLPFAEMNPLLYSAQQLTAVNLLEYEIKFLFVFEELDQLDDVWMALAMMERFDLFEYARSCMPGNFVDNFNGILQVGVERPTSLNRGVSAFSENFAGQSVQFLETRRHQ